MANPNQLQLTKVTRGSKAIVLMNCGQQRSAIKKPHLQQEELFETAIHKCLPIPKYNPCRTKLDNTYSYSIDILCVMPYTQLNADQ